MASDGLCRVTFADCVHDVLAGRTNLECFSAACAWQRVAGWSIRTRIITVLFVRMAPVLKEFQRQWSLRRVRARDEHDGEGETQQLWLLHSRRLDDESLSPDEALDSLRNVIFGDVHYIDRVVRPSSWIEQNSHVVRFVACQRADA